jgi:hypothetical protein
VKLNPRPDAPPIETPVAAVDVVELAVGVPPVQLDDGETLVSRVSAAPLPTSEMFEICDPPDDLWSYEVAAAEPQ